MLKGKNIVLGVSGGIAAYKAAALCSALVKQGANVDVIMTENATKFVGPMTFSTLTTNSVSVDTFARVEKYDVSHVSLAQKADVFVVAPATANIIAKMANGIADDMLSTTILASRAPKLVATAMNTGMLDNPATQENIARLKGWGVEFIDGSDGRLACGDVGRGRMAEPEEILDKIIEMLTPKDLEGRRVLITAGPTREALDPVRFLSNHSSGKMGYQLALAARNRGADVTLVSGPVELLAPVGITLVPVVSAADMFEAVKLRSAESDIIVKAAAVADYTPATQAREKIKKAGDGLTLELNRTQDILGWIGQNRRPGQVVVGFAMETQDLLANARAKLEGKNADIIAANSLRQEGAGFGVDTNIVTLITRDGARELPLMSKLQVANEILDRAVALL